MGIYLYDLIESFKFCKIK